MWPAAQNRRFHGPLGGFLASRLSRGLSLAFADAFRAIMLAFVVATLLVPFLRKVAAPKTLRPPLAMRIGRDRIPRSGGFMASAATKDGSVGSYQRNGWVSLLLPTQRTAGQSKSCGELI